jgi:ActR/RegA family two-component response regulator
MSTAVQTPSVVLLSDDLLWISRFAASAQALGLRLLAARDVQRLMEHLRSQTPNCVVIDLGQTLVEKVAKVIKELHPQVRLVGYGSHVDTAALEAARAAGCDAVLTRGQVAAELPELLSKWITR